MSLHADNPLLFVVQVWCVQSYFSIKEEECVCIKMARKCLGILELKFYGSIIWIEFYMEYMFVSVVLHYGAEIFGIT